VSRARDGALLIAALAILAAETIGQVFAGRDADVYLVGAALALLGVVPKLHKGDDD
jgi:hypothetical protein